MGLYQVRIAARKAGAIGQHGTEKRTCKILAGSHGAAEDMARRQAYAEGLEHVSIRLTAEIDTFGEAK